MERCESSRSPGWKRPRPEGGEGERQRATALWGGGLTTIDRRRRRRAAHGSLGKLAAWRTRRGDNGHHRRMCRHTATRVSGAQRADGRSHLHGQCPIKQRSYVPERNTLMRCGARWHGPEEPLGRGKRRHGCCVGAALETRLGGHPRGCKDRPVGCAGMLALLRVGAHCAWPWRNAHFAGWPRHDHSRIASHQVATISGGADSFFEYLLKAYVLFDDVYYGDVFAIVSTAQSAVRSHVSMGDIRLARRLTPTAPDPASGSPTHSRPTRRSRAPCAWAPGAVLRPGLTPSGRSRCCVLIAACAVRCTWSTHGLARHASAHYNTAQSNGMMFESLQAFWPGLQVLVGDLEPVHQARPAAWRRACMSRAAVDGPVVASSVGGEVRPTGH